MQARFLLGPAGSGKTFRCLAEIRRALEASPEGAPLLLIAPKQATYQLERQLLAGGSLAGFTRLQILSFERLAKFSFEHLQLPEPRLLDDEGRVMVLRALLTKRRAPLKLFRASARLNGFARHLSDALRELQRENLTPEGILSLADNMPDVPGLNLKLHDLATLLGEYLEWLKQQGLQDADCLLAAAVAALGTRKLPFQFAHVWVDGFAEFSGQELELLAAVVANSEQSTIAFCLHREPQGRFQRVSQWTMLEKTYLHTRKRIAAIPLCDVDTEILSGTTTHGRYAANPVIQHLEAAWETPKAFSGDPAQAENTVRLVRCANPEAEAVMAAQEIVRFVRAGGRYLDIAVLVRSLEPYHEMLLSVFTRYEIPFFLDRRESVSHHPLAELTRSALRTLERNWEHSDWFGVLKSGLTGIPEELVDRLENEAISHGWKGEAWQGDLVVPDNPALSRELNDAKKSLIEIFSSFKRNVGINPDGPTLSEALNAFWMDLKVSETLEAWSQSEKSGPNPIHETVWDQMRAWLKNIERAFIGHPISLRDWLPIIDAGLAGLSVGVIPPMLDQVLVGAIDRSRNPELRLCILLGLNEGLFPAPPTASVLLTDTDRCELEKQGYTLPTARQQLGRERFLAYVMFTRSSERLVVSFSTADSSGTALNESPFLTHFRRLFPALALEDFKRITAWSESEHAVELVSPLLKNLALPEPLRDVRLLSLGDIPLLAQLKDKLSHFEWMRSVDALSPGLAEKIYGTDLKTSVSRMEQFAACPFRFFVNSGLRAEERIKFEMDVRDQGNFQHNILAEFHESLKDEGKKWRDISTAEARERIAAIAASHQVSFRNGLLMATEQGKFAARMMTESLQDFVATLVGWMHTQYAFDPVAAEVPFGDKEGKSPPWIFELDGKHRLLLNGRIDRVDLCRATPGADEALCVVIDYKSSDKKLDATLMLNGLQLQLPAYLNVLRNWQNPAATYGVSKLIPSGVFYVNLRGQYEKGDNRDEALADTEGDTRLAYRHKGRFDQSALPYLDHRPAQPKGDQLSYARTKTGALNATYKDGMKPDEFLALLEQVEVSLREMGLGIYAGEAKVDPYRKGTATPCDYCDYRSICRIDPQTHQYRQLKKMEEAE